LVIESDSLFLIRSENLFLSYRGGVLIGRSENVSAQPSLGIESNDGLIGRILNLEFVDPHSIGVLGLFQSHLVTSLMASALPTAEPWLTTILPPEQVAHPVYRRPLYQHHKNHVPQLEFVFQALQTDIRFGGLPLLSKRLHISRPTLSVEQSQRQLNELDARIQLENTDRQTQIQRLATACQAKEKRSHSLE
jgi:hypothetical protein